MTSSRLHGRSALLALLLAAPACSDSTVPTPDGGALEDASATPDAGTDAALPCGLRTCTSGHDGAYDASEVDVTASLDGDALVFDHALVSVTGGLTSSFAITLVGPDCERFEVRVVDWGFEGSGPTYDATFRTASGAAVGSGTVEIEDVADDTWHVRVTSNGGERLQVELEQDLSTCWSATSL